MDRIYGVTFVLQRPDGKILMQLRDDGHGKNIIYPNMWCLPGGHIDNGESNEEAVCREIDEEYGLKLQPSDCRFLIEYDHTINIHDYVYLCRVPMCAKPILQEGADMKWMTVQEIKKIKLAADLNRIVLLIEEKIKL